jgi:glucose-6-phosphate 1-epimerase
VGAALGVSIEVRNPGSAPFTFEEALHTYLDLGDVRVVTVRGLGGARYLDKVDGGARKQELAADVRITGETDRVYEDHGGACAVDDPALGRRITLDKTGSRTTVLWNPWIAKAARMPDFGDDEWPGMICVETANALGDRVTLAPGAAHVMSLRLAAGRLAG